MNKKIWTVTCLLLMAGFHGRAQKTKVDTIAVAILDRMSAMIGDLSSCHVTIHSNYDVQSQHLGLVKHSDEEQLYLQGPDKLLIRSQGDMGERNLFYDGKTLSYYSVENNQYATLPLSVPIVQMIDTVNKFYGIDFAAADFFYPSFVDDMISESTNLIYLGMTSVDGRNCFHIAGTSSDKTYQFWITDDAMTLPLKMVIVYTGKAMDPQYEVELSDWQINPVLPPALFVFMKPPKAREIKMTKKGTKK